MEYVERTINEPEMVCEDKEDPALEHRLRKIEEYDNRVLRVVFNKTVDPIAIITVYYDRKMKGKV